MIAKQIHEIQLIDLRNLLGIVRESKTIEFKREMPAKKHEDVIKFLAAVSSLANTAGGDLVIGIDAPAGLAKAIPGVSFPDVDAEKLRLAQLLANGLEPRLPRVDIEAIPCSPTEHVLVIRTSQSWLAPHRLRVNDKFYGRNSAGKYPLDVSELRKAFVLSDSVAERIRNFRSDRLMKIIGDEISVTLPDNRSAMIIHVIPFSTFAGGQVLDAVEAVMKASQSRRVLPLPPNPQGSEYATVNLDGFITLASRDGESTLAYAQVFRSGAIEGVRLFRQRSDGFTPRSDGSSYFRGGDLENTIVAAISNYVSVIEAIDLGLPIFVFVSFYGMRNCYLREAAGAEWHDRGPLKVDTVLLPEIVIYNNDPQNLPVALRPHFNTIWHGFGQPRSPQYNANGEWIGAPVR